MSDQIHIIRVGRPAIYGGNQPEGVAVPVWSCAMPWGSISQDLAQAVGAVRFGDGWVVDAIIDGVLVGSLGLRQGVNGSGIILGREVQALIERALLGDPVAIP